MITNARAIAAGLVLALALGGAACGDDKKDVSAGSGSSSTTVATGAGGLYGTGSTTAGAAAGAAAASFQIKGFSFPSGIKASAGSDVKITNGDGTEHTVTADKGEFDVDVPSGGATLKAPAKAGTYAFHCKIHTSMKGELVVT